MDLKTTIDLIIKDLNEASEIIDDLKKYPGVPAIQVELAKSKCRSAGEVIALLKNIDFRSDSEKEKASEEEKIDHGTPEPEPPKRKQHKTTTVKQHDIRSETASEPENKHKEQTDKIIEQQELPTENSELVTIADKFKDPGSLYEEQTLTISEGEFSERLKPKSMSSISEVIGISDKFLLMGQLFNGNKELYNQAIERLDSAENLQDAKAIIMSYKGENTENEAVALLLDLVKLKLSINE